MDIASISAALGSIKAASDIAKLEVANVQSQLIEKDEQIKELHSLLEQKKSLTYV